MQLFVVVSDFLSKEAPAKEILRYVYAKTNFRQVSESPILLQP